MNDTPDTRPLAVRAVEAVEQAEREEAEAARRREQEKQEREARELCRLLARNLGAAPDPENLFFVDGRAHVRLEGLEFAHLSGYCGRDEAVLVGKCEQCGLPRHSYPLTCLQDLGSALRGGFWSLHTCPEPEGVEGAANTAAEAAPAPPPPTPEMALLAALEVYIDSRVGALESTVEFLHESLDNAGERAERRRREERAEADREAERLRYEVSELEGRLSKAERQQKSGW